MNAPFLFSSRYLQLSAPGKFHRFCNFRDNFWSNEWISMTLYSWNVTRAWALSFGFGPDICSYLPLAEFHRFCNFRMNFSSNQHFPMKLYIYKALRAWMLPFCFRADICSYLPLAKFHRFAIFAITYVLMNGFQWNFVVAMLLGHGRSLLVLDRISVICPWQISLFLQFLQ